MSLHFCLFFTNDTVVCTWKIDFPDCLSSFSSFPIFRFSGETPISEAKMIVEEQQDPEPTTVGIVYHIDMT